VVLILGSIIELVLPGTLLNIELEKGNEEDPYGRTLAYVYLPDGRCVNEIMVAEGYAKPYSRFYCSELRNYQILNMKAKNEKRGLYQLVGNFEKAIIILTIILCSIYLFLYALF